MTDKIYFVIFVKHRRVKSARLIQDENLVNFKDWNSQLLMQSVLSDRYKCVGCCLF